jgi:hypothetical protein
MHLDKHYVYIRSKNYTSRFAKTTYNLERRKYVLDRIVIMLDLDLHESLIRGVRILVQVIGLACALGGMCWCMCRVWWVCLGVRSDTITCIQI